MRRVTIFNLSEKELFAFKSGEMRKRGEALHETYVSARPFPHIAIDDFMKCEDAQRLLQVFPPVESDVWLDWRKRDRVHQPKKLGIGHASRLDSASPYLLNVLATFNSHAFIHFLEALTGIRKLLPDPHLHGGGIQQILSGGRLAVHADFNLLEELDLFRRVNVLLYLNTDWKPEYDGNLELWEEGAESCAKVIPPLFNRLVVFNTTKSSLHGHPNPLNTPKGVTRKSLALYYYTAKPAPGEVYDSVTDWHTTAQPKHAHKRSAAAKLLRKIGLTGRRRD